MECTDKKLILVVDDEVTTLRSLKRTLETNYTVAIALTDKNGNIVNNIIAPIGVLAATATANEIVRLGVTSNGNKPGLLMVDPYEKILTAIISGDEMPDVQNKNSVLKERYHFCIVVQNSAEVAANKTFTIVMDCIIP